MLLLVSVLVILYTLADMGLGWISAMQGTGFQFDSTLTGEVFGFARWVVASGASITIAKTVKGSTNSDDTEPAQVPPEG